MKKRILFDNDLLVQAKQHTLPIIYAITNSVLFIEILLLLNYVISSANLGQGIIYDRIIFFYNLVILSLFIIVYILTPIFNSGSITNMYNNNKLINLIVALVERKEIVYEKIRIGVINTSLCIISTLPLCYVSLFFGGIDYIKILKVILILFIFIVLYTTVCVTISSYNKNTIISFLISYLVELIILIPTMLLLKTLINNLLSLIVYIIVSIVLIYAFFLVSLKGSTFSL